MSSRSISFRVFLRHTFFLSLFFFCLVFVIIILICCFRRRLYSACNKNHHRHRVPHLVLLRPIRFIPPHLAPPPLLPHSLTLHPSHPLPLHPLPHLGQHFHKPHNPLTCNKQTTQKRLTVIMQQRYCQRLSNSQ